MNPTPQHETPRRPRHPDDHGLTAASSSNPSQRPPMASRDYASAAPRINLDQGASESQYQPGGQVPGSLQPGRQGAVSANTAPAVPTISQNVSQDPYSPSRSQQVHGYARSSPATGFEGQGYGSYGGASSGAADQVNYATTPTQKYTPQGTQRAISSTPLGLADIRPRAESESTPGSNPYLDGANAVPTNSNYLAPWAVYAFDWCKWPAQNNDAGKVALGSYLEDGHNFVSILTFQLSSYIRITTVRFLGLLM